MHLVGVSRRNRRPHIIGLSLSQNIYKEVRREKKKVGFEKNTTNITKVVKFRINIYSQFYISAGRFWGINSDGNNKLVMIIIIIIITIIGLMLRFI